MNERRKSIRKKALRPIAMAIAAIAQMPHSIRAVTKDRLTRIDTKN